MVRRHKRRKSLTAFERETFVEDATEMHETLLAYTFVLAPHAAEYKAIARLHEAVIQAIRDVTGDDPEWMRVQRSWYPGE